MKKLTGLVLILAVLVLGGYYGMGILTEKTIKQNTQIINQSNGLLAEIEQYNRGWFSSDVKIKWSLHIPAHVVKDDNGQFQTMPAQDYKIEMPFIIHHGPVIFSNNRLRFGLGYAETVVPLSQQYATQFDSMFTKESIKPQVDLSIFVNYLNQSTVDLSIPAFNLIAKEGNGHFDWLGMDLSTTISSGMKKIDGTIALNGMKVSKDDTKMNLDKVSSDYALHETPAGLYLGDANFKLTDFDVLIKDQNIFDVANFTMQSDSDIEQKLFSTHFKFTLKSLLANGLVFGPGDMDVSLRNLDADILAQINKQATDMQNGTDVERQQAIMAMLPELPKLFGKGAEFEISKLTLKIPQGMVEGTLFVSLPKGDVINPFELIQKIQGKAKLQLPIAALKQLLQQTVVQELTKQPSLQQTLVQQLQGGQTSPNTNQAAPTVDQLAAMQVDKQLKALEQNGVIIVKGTDYLMEISLEQGKFTVNGKPFDSSMLNFSSN